MKLDELLGQLPGLSAATPLTGPFRTVPKDAIQCPAQVAPWFMIPPVTVQAGINLEQIPVVLVSAPAGVGKTTAAALIAKTLRTPLWNLAKLSVGHGKVAATPARGEPGDPKRAFQVPTRLRPAT